MKKKILSLALAFGLMLSAAGTTTAYADEVVTSGATIETAVAREFDTDYSVTWADGLDASWNIVTLDENGILDIMISKVTHDTLGILDVYAEIYDEDGNYFYQLSSADDDTTSPHFYAGLAKGTYYIKLYSAYGTGYAHGKTATFRFAFTASSKCELEKNDTKATATAMEVDTKYTGYLGSDYVTSASDRDDADLYKVKLTKGNAYKFTFTTAKGTTIVKLLGKDVELGTLWPSVEADKFCLAPGETFVAPYTGTYYVYIYNYFGAQYEYSVKITDVTPKATSLTSVTAKSGGFTAKWSKVTCNGYEIQYSTSKSFKNATTVDVAKSKKTTTIKSLTSKKKYYARIRTYKKVGSNYSYSSWSSAKTVTTK